MLSELKTKRKVIGVKQSLKAVRAGQGLSVSTWPEDADPALLAPIRRTLRRRSDRIRDRIGGEHGRAWARPAASRWAPPWRALLKEETMRLR